MIVEAKHNIGARGIALQLHAAQDAGGTVGRDITQAAIATRLKRLLDGRPRPPLRLKRIVSVDGERRFVGGGDGDRRGGDAGDGDGDGEGHRGRR